MITIGLCLHSEKMSYTDYPTRLLFLIRGIERLERLGLPESVPKNHMIAKPGSVVDSCYIVKSGRIISFEYTSTGEERVYNFNEAGSLFLESVMLLRQQCPVYFMASMPSDLIRISREKLLAALLSDPQIALDVIESLSNKFLASMDQIRQSSSHNAAWKICNLLLIFAERFGIPYDGKILIKEKVNQQMLSNLLGINRITTVRVIKGLKAMGLIEVINGFYCLRSVEQMKLHLQMLDNLFAAK